MSIGNILRAIGGCSLPAIAGLLLCLLGAAGQSPVLDRPQQARSSPYAPSQAVGSLAASFGVDGNGSATWTLDVQVPPGTAGVAPNLSITYDSHRGNGYLGMGFALSGISAITRCGANYRNDGYKAGVNYDARDRFCLDGRRLIAVSGQYGADGTVYHTEIETWTVLTSHGTCGGGPCSFTGTDKDGNVLSFGATSGSNGSRILAQGRNDGAVRTWSIDARTDLNGNKVTVSYVNDAANGEYYPNRIDYTSNAGAGLTAQRSVRFGYAVRPDVMRRFIGGSQVQISQLLTSISTYVSVGGSDQNVLTYKLAYLPSDTTKRSRLTTITLCDAAGTCWPPSTFDWYTDTAQFAPATSAPQLPGPTYVRLDGRLYPFGVLMDIDGDGIADYSKATEFVDGHKDLTVYLGQPDGSFKQASYSLPGPIWRVTSNAIVQTGLLRDINGDGVLDFSAALRNEDAGTSDFTVWVGNGHGFTKNLNYQLPGPIFWQVNGQTLTSGVLEDIDGDGLPDYSRATVLPATGEKFLDIYKGTGTGFTKTGTTLPGPLYAVDASGSREVGVLRDINGDGIADYSAATVNADAGTQDLHVYIGHSPDFTFNYAYDLPGQMLWIVNGVVLESGALVDINGDGIADYSRATRLESTREQILDVYLGTANGFTAKAFQLPGPLYSILDNESYIQGVLTNWNGDGTTRYSRATQWSNGTQDLALYLGSGNGFSPMGKNLPKAMFLVLDNGTYANAEYQDVNGDGITDFVDSVCTLEADGSFTNCTLGVQLGQGPFSDLLKSVKNGFNGETTVDYAPLTSGLYAQTGTSAYPIRNAEGSMIVVAGYTNSDGRGNSYRYTYSYSGGRIDALGYGWLGFETVTMTTVADGRAAKVTYDQTFPFAGMVQSSQVLDGKGKLLAGSAYTYIDIASSSMQQFGVHQPLRSSETFTQYTDNKPDYSLQTRYTYDAYGNVTITSDLADLSSEDDDVYACSRYFNDPAIGRYGYEQQTKVDRTLQGCQNFVNAPDPNKITWDASVDLRWSKTDYDAKMNVVSKSHYDDSNSVFLTDAFTFDPYGNILSATNAAGNTTTYSYDATYHSFPTTITSPKLTRGSDTYTLTTSTTYDPGFGVLTSTTDPNGNVTTQNIDGFGRSVEVYGPNDSGTSMLLVTVAWTSANGTYYLQTRQRPDWSSNDQSTWYWDRQYYDGLDRVYRTERYGIKSGQPATIATDTAFDAQGRVHTTTMPYYTGDAAPTTTIEYDAYNRPILSTDPAGVKHKIDYANGGRKITRTNAYDTPDAQTEISYLTGRGLVRQSVAPNGATTTYGRDPLGQVTSVTTSPVVRSTTITYDSIGRARRIENSNTGVSTWTFDATGLLTQTTDGAGNVTAYTSYDALGRLRQRLMTYTGGTASAAYTYDDPTYANGLGNLTGVQMTQGAAGSFAYTYGYTAYGEVKVGTMTIAGNEYVYGTSYDPLGRVVSTTYPSGDVLSMTYLTDADVGTVSLTENGQSQAKRYASYSDYTALGQSQQTKYDRTGVSVSTAYYPIGDSFAQLKTTKAATGSTTLYSRSYTWNKLNSLTGITDLQSSASNETYGYNDQPATAHMGFLTSAKGTYGPQNYSYDALGNVGSKTGVTMTYAAGKDWLTATSVGTAFAYYPNGNLKMQSDASASWGYTYDSGGLLVQVDKTVGSSTQSGYAAYDASGRRVFYQRIGETQKTYHITADFEVIDLGNNTYQHTVYVPGTITPIAAITRTGKGNRVTAATHTVLGGLYSNHSLKGNALSAWHRASAAMVDRQSHVLPFGTALTLAGFGLFYVRLTRRPVPGANAPRPFFTWSTPLVALCYLFSTIAPSYAALTPGANGVGVPTPGYTFFLPNQLESTVLVTDENGTVTATLSYYPDGSVDQEHSTGTDNFRPKFVGSEWDPTTALYHMGVRYYSPALGRFISPDPVNQFTSPYLYAGNNPVSAIDPDGEFAFVVAMIVGAVIGAVAGAYFGGVAVNHDMNPLHWNWRSGKTYAGLFVGAVIGAVGGAAGGLSVQAGVAIGASGGLAAEAAGVAIGIAGQTLVGAGENAAFTALGGGSAKEVLLAAGEGALWSAAFAGTGEAMGGLAAQFARRTSTVEEGVEDIAGAAARREKSAVEEIVEDVCGASFIAGTLVIGADGERLVIRDIRVGDHVAGRNVPGNADTDGTVTQLVRRQTDTLVTLTFGDGDTVTTTPDHPFRGYQRGWIPAKDLGAGELLDGANGQPITVAAVSMHRADLPTTVYNFEVAGTQTYRVGNDGVLVHNPAKSCREIAMGKTPSKKSKTGREVWNRWFAKKKARINKGVKEVKVRLKAGAQRQWVELDSKIHMGHKEDAVDWWNRVGFKFGAKAKQVRAFMRDPTKYRFEWGPLNSSNGAKLGQVYKRPAGYVGKWPP